MYSAILYGLLNVLYCLVFALLILTICYYYKFFTLKYYLNKWPCVPQLPLIGSALHYKTTVDVYNNLLNFPKKYGRTYWSIAGFECLVFTSDVKLLEVILSSSKHIEKPPAYKLLKSAAGNGLLASTGDTWRSHRKLLNPTFHFKILEQFMPVFNKYSDELVKKLDIETAKPSTDVLCKTREWALAEVTETVMGLKSNERHESYNDQGFYGKEGKELLKIAMSRVIRPNEFYDLTYYFTRNYWKEQTIIKAMDDRVRSVIRQKEEEYDLYSGSKEVNDVGIKKKIASLDMLVEARRQGHQITETDMIHEAHTLMFTGHDTTANTVAFAIYNFARFPEVQEKVFEEVYDVLGGDIHQEITIAHLKEMKYLDMALQESMRLIEGVPIIGRELGEEIEFDGNTLPKGLPVYIALSAVHHDPEYYPEPYQFIPERFTPENCKKRNPYTYIPFSAGPKNCIGIKYGMLASKVGLVKAVLNYKFLDVGHKPIFAAEIAAVPVNGIKVAFRPRDIPKY